MRYELGEKVIGIKVRFKPSEARWSNLYLPDRDTLEGIDLIEMTVVKHARVPWDQDPEEKLEYDGYVLEASDGTVFHNQYPKASYGQVTDSANWTFSYAEVNEDNFLKSFEDVGVYLQRIIRNLSNRTSLRSEGIPEELAKALQKHHDDILQLIQSQFGLRVTYVPRSDFHCVWAAGLEYVPHDLVDRTAVKSYTLYWPNGREEVVEGFDLLDALSASKIEDGIREDGVGTAAVLTRLDSVVEGGNDKLVYVNRIGEEGTDKPKIWRELKIPTVVE